MDENTVFTNTALTDDGDVWWEDLHRRGAGAPHRLEGSVVDAGVRRSRRAPELALLLPPPRRCPSIAPEWEDPKGVPISAFLFGGRRATTVPLVFESHSTGSTACSSAATMGSEKTAAATGGLGDLRRDPFAMLPFCGYNMADYFTHWLSMAQRTDEASLPGIYGVNWFRKDDDGNFLWPGFGENSRVLEWICKRLDGDGSGNDTAIGVVPGPDDLDLDGLDVPAADIAAALAVDDAAWKAELPGIREYFAGFGERMPRELVEQLDALEARLA